MIAAGREFRVPDLVDGRDIRRRSALHRDQQLVAVFRVGDRGDVDLDVRVGGLEFVHGGLLEFAQTGFGLLVVPEFQRDLILCFGLREAEERQNQRHNEDQD